MRRASQSSTTSTCSDRSSARSSAASRWETPDARAGSRTSSSTITGFGYCRRSARSTTASVGASTISVSSSPASAARPLARAPTPGAMAKLGRVARHYVSATARRKDLLYRAAERHRVALRLVHDARREKERPRILLFHERVAEAEELFAALHGAVRRRCRSRALAAVRLAPRQRRCSGSETGPLGVLVSVKSLIEGIDVPAADVGISVASTSSVRQRVQSLGRVLRRPFDDGARKEAEMHLIYVARHRGRGHLREGGLGRSDRGSGQSLLGLVPGPRCPAGAARRASSDASSDRGTGVGSARAASARRARAVARALPDREYSVDTSGTVTTASGAIVANTPRCRRDAAPRSRTARRPVLRNASPPAGDRLGSARRRAGRDGGRAVGRAIRPPQRFG